MTHEPRPAILRTERLLLRPFLEGDVDDVYRYARREEWSRYLLPQVPYPYERADAEAFVARALATPWNEEANWAAVLDERVIGGVGVHLGRDDGAGELGYSFSPDHWGRGYAPEAARAVLDYAFYVLGLEGIEATADVRNAGSVRVMEKLGMGRVALESGGRVDRSGAAVDGVRYRVTRTQWMA